MPKKKRDDRKQAKTEKILLAVAVIELVSSLIELIRKLTG